MKNKELANDFQNRKKYSLLPDAQKLGKFLKFIYS